MSCSCDGSRASFQVSLKELQDYVDAAEKNFFKKLDLHSGSPGAETLLLFNDAGARTGVGLSRDEWKTGHFYYEIGTRVFAYTVSGKFREENTLQLDFDFVQPEKGHGRLLIQFGRLGSISCSVASGIKGMTTACFDCLVAHAPQWKSCGLNLPCWVQKAGGAVGECEAAGSC